MGLTITEKVLKEHLMNGELNSSGGEIGIRIDQTLTQDATGTMAYLQFEAMGIERVQNELAVSYVDHNSVQIGFENADDHRYLKAIAAKYGIIFSRPGNGICHQLHLERFGKPGKTLLGSDSHTPTGGGIGMLAMGAGGIDVAVAMGGGPFHLNSPKVINIHLKGKLQEWVSAKDVILHVLSIFGTRGNVGCVFEYGGSGVATLTVPERATITNMGAECGVTTSIFPSDEITRSFLKAQGREKNWRELTADDDAVYDKVVDIDLSKVEPLAAAPHSPGNIESVVSLSGKKVDQVLIGSCTNSSYADLRRVAEILAGRKVHPDTVLGIAPGSRQVVGMLADEGKLANLIGAGARLLENACGFCIGNSMSPKSNAVSLRTSNRNFEGRSGTKSAEIYLVSPEIAAVAAIYGKFVDPRSVEDLKYPQFDLPTVFSVDDSMFLAPSEDPENVEVFRGPNIGDPPASIPLKEDLRGMATIKVGDNITTDHIMPAGARLKFRSNIKKYSTFVFENTDSDFPERAASNRDKGVDNIIVAGVSYGQGSSREHAALCPMYLGVKAVLAKSMERIHKANLVNFGIVPLTFQNEDDYDRIDQNDELSIKGIASFLQQNSPLILKNITKDENIPVDADLSDRQRDIVIAGGLLNFTKLNNSE